MVPGQRKSLVIRTRHPSDDELVAFVTEPMTSIAVARHFALPGPVCLRRMRQLVDRGRLTRPWLGVYAPAGTSSGSKPPTDRRAQVLAVLDQPRTAAEVGALTGLDCRATNVIHTLLREGHAVRCGPSHFLRADLEGQFEPRKRLPRPRPLIQKGMVLREQIMALLAEPRGADEVARLLKVKQDRIDYMLRRLIREGRVTRAVREGYRERYIYSCATHG